MTSSVNISPAQRGFTLIELLVVISIIGMLASVILVSLSAARTKAVQGAALEFAAANYHSLGTDAYIYYNFDNDTSSGIIDQSAHGYNASIVGNFNEQSGTPSGSGKSFYFDNNTYLLASPVGGVTLNCTSQSTGCVPLNYTMSVWVNPDPSSSGHTQYYLYNPTFTDSGIKLYYTSNHLISYGWGGLYAYTLPYNQWTLLTTSYNNTTGITTLYVNGNMANTYTNTYPRTSDSTNIYIGGTGSGQFITGSMDDFTIYSSALSDAQVKEIYAVGAVKHGLAVR